MKKKLTLAILTIAIIVTCFCSVAIAAPSVGLVNPSNEGIKGLGTTILGYIQWAGYAVAIGMLIYIGIKYAMASADGKADLKAAMIKYVIGAILIAGAATIAGWLFEIGGTISGTNAGNGTTTQSTPALPSKPRPSGNKGGMTEQTM